MTMQAECKCGWREEITERFPLGATETNLRRLLEVLADTHEVQNIRRSYRHATVVTLVKR